MTGAPLDRLDRFARLGQRLFNTPLMVHPPKAEMVVAALADRLGIVRIDGLAPRPMAWSEDQDPYAPNRYGTDCPYELIGPVAVIEASGLLVQKSGTVRPFCGMTGYDGLRLAFLHAAANDQARGIVLDMDSCGGEVAGCFDLVDTIHRIAQEKPVWAILNEVAYSAGYALASAANRITLPRTGGAGSIGVVAMHVDFSAALSKDGVAVTFIQFGDRKTDGNEFEPLAKEARARFQAEIDRTGELFIATVARNRGLKPDQIRAQQAATFHGPDAVGAGLVDEVIPPDQAFEKFLASL